MKNLQNEYGKLPPQALEVEEVILGAIMLERDAFMRCAGIIHKESFYSDKNKTIFEAVETLLKEGSPIDIISVTKKLRAMGKLDFVGGAFAISELTNRVSSAANIEYHARIVAQKYILRMIINSTSKATAEAYDETIDVFTLLSTIQAELLNLSGQSMAKKEKKIDVIADETMKRIEAAGQKTDGLVGVPSGIVTLDRITSGWREDSLIIVAGRPGMGKTSLVLSAAKNAAVDFKIPVQIFSLEMSETQLCTNLFSIQSEIENTRIERGVLDDYEWTRLIEAKARISNAPLYIDDSSGLDIIQLRAKCIRAKAEHGIKLFIIDYLQLMDGHNKKQSTYDKISEISRGLKLIAKEIKTPVIALSQLSRSVEQRGGSKRPMLSDLKESGSIEQDADQVIFVYRPEYYGTLEDSEGNSTAGVAELIVAKNRHGSPDSAWCEFVDRCVTFRDFHNQYSYNEPNF